MIPQEVSSDEKAEVEEALGDETVEVEVALSCKKVIFISGEGKRKEISREAASLSELVQDMLHDDDDDVPEVPLPEVNNEVLLRVVSFLEKHKTDPMKEIPKPIPTTNLEEIVGEWDAKFMDVDQPMLFQLILAANYMDIPSLLDLGIGKLACMVKGKTPDEIKKMFHITEDITPEEEKIVRDQNQWIFDIDPRAT